MENITPLILAIFGASGFWALVTFLVQKLLERKSTSRKALEGLLHDRIYEICREIITRQSVTEAEYENLLYLYEPYRKLGGNGTAEKMKAQVDKIELTTVHGGKNNE